MLSSAGEHRPYKAGVTGSNPVASTSLIKRRAVTLNQWVNSEVAKRG